jgi:hypothetical protein
LEKQQQQQPSSLLRYVAISFTRKPFQKTFLFFSFSSSTLTIHLPYLAVLLLAVAAIFLFPASSLTTVSFTDLDRFLASRLF